MWRRVGTGRRAGSRGDEGERWRDKRQTTEHLGRRGGQGEKGTGCGDLSSGGKRSGRGGGGAGGLCGDRARGGCRRRPPLSVPRAPGFPRHRTMAAKSKSPGEGCTRSNLTAPGALGTEGTASTQSCPGATPAESPCPGATAGQARGPRASQTPRSLEGERGSTRQGAQTRATVTTHTASLLAAPSTLVPWEDGGHPAAAAWGSRGSRQHTGVPSCAEGVRRRWEEAVGCREPGGHGS